MGGIRDHRRPWGVLLRRGLLAESAHVLKSGRPRQQCEVQWSAESEGSPRSVPRSVPEKRRLGGAEGGGRPCACAARAGDCRPDGSGPSRDRRWAYEKGLRQQVHNAGVALVPEIPNVEKP